MTDQPTKCPQCGVQAEMMKEATKDEPYYQVHFCHYCKFLFLKEEDK
jgi:uncharacterized Zn finger protein